MKEFQDMSTRELQKAAGRIRQREQREAELKDFASRIRQVSSIEEKEQEWLVPYWIPKGEITILAGDGGIGKTSVWSRILSELSSGRPCFLQDGQAAPPEAARCLFFSSEDTVSARLKKHFDLYGANEKNLFTIEHTLENRDALKRMKFDSEELRMLLVALRPAICVFDPIQAYLPAEMNMNSRNGIRSCMDALAVLGKNYGTSFLLVCHTNKRENSSGRNRISNSADLWDAARSVIMTGYADGKALKYLSNEKNNYAPLQKTLLYTIDPEEGIRIEGTTEKREKDFLKAEEKNRPVSRLQECASAVLALLEEAEGNTMRAPLLVSTLLESGYSLATVKRAKALLKAGGEIDYIRTGFGSEGMLSVRLTEPY